MAADVEPVRIAVENRGVRIAPGDGASNLLGHYAQIAVGRAEPYKIRDQEMSAGIDEHFRRKAAVCCRAAEPGAAMKVDENRCLRPLRPINVEPLKFTWTIGNPLRGAKARAHLFAVAGKSRADLAGERRVEGLIIGGIELNLIHVQPDPRALRVC